MVVMVRSIGVPARLVVGYATGKYDQPNGRFIVTEADAHSWVEVYFPGIGWVDFEPTGGRPAFLRPGNLPLDEMQAAVDADAVQPPPRWQMQVLAVMGWLAATLTAAAGILFVWWVTGTIRLNRMPPARAVSRLYRNLLGHGRALGIPRQPNHTPYEFGSDLVIRVTGLETHSVNGELTRLSRAIAPTIDESREMINIYAQSVYSQHGIIKSQQRIAIRRWSRLRLRLWLMRLLQSWRKFRSRSP